MSTTYADGNYLVEVLDQGFGESEVKKTPFFFLQCKVIARIGADGQHQACPQYERTYRQHFGHELGGKILRGDLKALGVEVDDLLRLDLGAADPISLVG